MIQLHYHPGNASMVPHILLEELGVAYQRVLVDRAVGAHKSPEYLKLNPNGQIPVLSDGDLVLYETAAIALHLCDSHPDAGLAPPVGSAERAHFYKWLMWLTNTMQATLMIYFYPDRWVAEGNVGAAAEVKLHAERKVAGLLDQLDGELARNGGPWLAGSAYTALDPYAFTLCRWTRNFANEAPARSRAQLGPYLQRMLARTAVQRVLAIEKLPPPLV
jgi:glutathione S-transferase